MKGLRIIGIVILTAACSVSAGPEAAALFGSAKLAVEQGRYTEALKSLAQISVFHGRDPVVPAAVFYEGLVYKQTGQLETARQTAEELVLGWPESDWSRRAEELK